MSEEHNKYEDLLDIGHEVGLLSKPARVSPSTINDFIERRSSWYMKKVMGISKFRTSDYLQRGKAVETGLEAMLKGASEDEAMRKALTELHNFDEFAFTEEELAELKASLAELESMIPKYIYKAYQGYKAYALSGLKESQAKVEFKPDFCSFSLYGYVDFRYSNMWTDLKILGRKPSTLSQGYCIQGTVYDKALQAPGIFTVLTRTNPKSGEEYHFTELHLRKQPREVDWWFDYIRLACIAMEGIYDCAQSGDVDDLIKHMSFPNLESFYGENDIKDALQYWRKK